MILLKNNKNFKIISDNALSYHKKFYDFVCFLDTKKFPSLKCLKVTERKFNNFDELTNLLTKKIDEKQEQIIFYDKQLKNLNKELKILGLNK